MTDTEREALCTRIDELCAELGRSQLNRDMWHDRAEVMRNRLSAAQAENAKLREERREYQATIDSLVDECTDHKDENAKLLELCHEIWRSCPVEEDECKKCPHYLGEDDDVWCDIPIQMAELGIEMRHG